MKFSSLKYFPQEVLVPQVFPASSTCFPFVFAWWGGGSVVRTLHGHKISAGLKVWVPKVDFKGGWGCVLRIPDQSRISPNYLGASHGTVRFPDPISAQPARSRSRENDRIKTACNRTAQPATETDQPRSEPCSTPQKWHRIALYCWIPVTRQHDTEHCLQVSDCMGAHAT